MKKYFVFLPAVLLLAAGCNVATQQQNSPVVQDKRQEQPTKPVTGKPVQETQKSKDNTADWSIYRNTKYNYEFKYPRKHTVYSGISNEEKLIPATATSETATLAEIDDADFPFGTEINTIHVEQVATNLSSQEWVKANAETYSFKNEIKSTKEITFGDKTATELRGAGNLGSAYRLIAIKNANRLTLIRQRAESQLLEQVLSTFKFTK